MKYANSFLIFSLAVLVYATVSGIITQGSSGRKVVDRIEAIIYHPDGSKVITSSDIKPNLDGNPRTLEQIVFEQLMLIDAGQIKQLEVTDADVNKYINQMRTQNKLNHEDIVELFKQSGFTFEEGREQLKNQLIADRVISYRVKNNIVVTDEDIATFYDENPEYKDATYTISQAAIPFGEGLKSLKKVAIEQAIESGEVAHVVNWSNPITLKEHDLDESKAFVKELAVGQIMLFSETDDSFIIIRMDEKQIRQKVPLEDMEELVRRALLNQRFDAALRAYRDKLLTTTRVTYPAQKAQS